MGRAVALARRTAGIVLDLLLPPRCILCGKETDRAGTLCAPCWRGIVFIAAPYCAGCGVPFPYDPGPAALCGACPQGAVRRVPLISGR